MATEQRGDIIVVDDDVGEPSIDIIYLVLAILTGACRSLKPIWIVPFRTRKSRRLLDRIDPTLNICVRFRSSTTASLTSSVMKYQYENGRRYHRYQEGRYLLPNDEKEQHHMDILEHMFKLILSGKLYLAPISSEIERILDIGTGTGGWVIDMAELFPDAHLIGNDLSPIQPRMVPPNVSFEVDDAENEWTYSQPFDFIHCRYMATSIRDWPLLFSRVFKNLKPEGWAEFYDFDLIYKSDDGSLTKDHELYINSAQTCAAAEKLGQPSCPGPQLKGWAVDAGFTNVEEFVFKIPIGPWAKDPKLKEIGAWNQIQSLEGNEGWSMALLTRVMGWTPEKVREHLVRLRAEYRDTSIHAYITAFVVFGQKPKN
ncbi:hypothetical protein FQN57_004146 [Myotisia sp. PD_48]|nr:hypothetical protein FQN57_004146 [Myotisia sp. PD_48]